ncbi:MAG: hypothetical protein H7249_06660 [Chitinophagaceae bacterium]|nr:hypothetical protein [Oligoflexus sp.]
MKLQILKARAGDLLSLSAVVFVTSAVLMFATGCAHQGDDDYPVRHGSAMKQPELVSPPVPPPASPAPIVNPPLVTMPPPPAPAPATAAARAPGPVQPKMPLPSQTATFGPVSGSALQLSEPLSAPVRRLINAAEDSLKKGKILEARAQADRAYRMDLRDPRTSFLMARVSEREKSYDDAEQWARRSLETLGDAGNKRIVWNFIASVRSKNGNKKGAQEAMRQVHELKR